MPEILDFSQYFLRFLKRNWSFKTFLMFTGFFLFQMFSAVYFFLSFLFCLSLFSLFLSFFPSFVHSIILSPLSFICSFFLSFILSCFLSFFLSLSDPPYFRLDNFETLFPQSLDNSPLPAAPPFFCISISAQPPSKIPL